MCHKDGRSSLIAQGGGGVPYCQGRGVNEHDNMYIITQVKVYDEGEGRVCNSIKKGDII